MDSHHSWMMVLLLTLLSALLVAVWTVLSGVSLSCSLSGVWWLVLCS